jgi:Tol biopolymer transport system component
MVPAYEAGGQEKPMASWPDSLPIAPGKNESSLSNVRQLTFGGQNAEAYWSKDGDKIVWQSMQPGFPDEQIFTMNADGSGKRLISTGLGRTTCSYFTPDEKYVYFSSTHHKNPGPQVKLDMSQGYVWKVNPQFGLFRAKVDGTQVTPIIIRRGYVAETTISPDGTYMTFTGGFDGDLDIYRANLDGSNMVRLTSEFGYDGGPFVSWDGRKIVYRRAPAFTTDAERKAYLALWKQNLVRPSRMELWIMDSDGRNKRQVTNLGGANFAPFLHPNGRTIIFCSNFHDPKGREFDLFTVDLDGRNLRRVTSTPDFDGFPMFSRDGKKLVWASNRNGKVRGETNVFVADWVE